MMAADVHVGTLLMVVTLIISRIPVALVDQNNESLYSKDDQVQLLDVNNFRSVVGGAEHAWFVEFFSSWCGHCIRFAPTWKQLAEELAAWAPVIKLAAIDCASEDNLPICRDYQINGYPTLRYIGAQAGKEDIGLDFEQDRDLETLQHGMIDFLQNISTTRSKPRLLPKLESLRRLDEIWQDVTLETKYTVVIFEDTNSYLGMEVILDLHRHKKLVLRRMTNRYFAKYAIKNYPALFLIESEGTFKKLTNKTDRAGFVSALNKLIGVKDTITQVKHVGQGHQGPPQVKSRSPSHVYLGDLESAVHYSLRQEVAKYQEISGEKLDALKQYVLVLAKYFPGSESTVRFLKLVAAWVQNERGPLTGDKWLKHINHIQTDTAFLPARVAWVGCQGSTPTYRGYPCGLWTLFHSLSVNAVLDSGDMEDFNPQEVVAAMRNYIHHFFGCRECSQNFMKMAVAMETHVKVADDAILWLWRSHNKVNQRLHGDETEDPAHPKVPFPDTSLCPRCHGNQGGRQQFDNKQILIFLKKFYSRDEIVKEDDLKKDKYRKVDKKDVIRRQDLVKLSQRRAEKQQKALDQLKDSVKIKLNESKNFLHERLQRIDMKTRSHSRVSINWGLNSVDISMCLVFYIVCTGIIVLTYYHFNFHVRKCGKRCCSCLLR